MMPQNYYDVNVILWWIKCLNHNFHVKETLRKFQAFFLRVCTGEESRLGMHPEPQEGFGHVTRSWPHFKARDEKVGYLITEFIHVAQKRSARPWHNAFKTVNVQAGGYIGYAMLLALNRVTANSFCFMCV